MSAPRDLLEIRCGSCRRRLAVAMNPNRAYCDVLCSSDFDALPYEERDAVIETLWMSQAGPTITQLVEMFKLSRQRIDQVLQRRNVKAEKKRKEQAELKKAEKAASKRS